MSSASAATTEKTGSVLSKLYVAVVGGDAESAISCMHPQVEVEEPAHLPFGGVYRGLDGMGKVLGMVSRYLNLQELTVNTLIADGENGLAIVTVPMREEGTDVVVIAQHWQLQAGRIARGKLFVFDPPPLLQAA